MSIFPGQAVSSICDMTLVYGGTRFKYKKVCLLTSVKIREIKFHYKSLKNKTQHQELIVLDYP